jgi:hypothetical protein
MRSPSSDLFEKWQELFASGAMVGPDRPVGRVTLGMNHIRSIKSERPGPWRYMQFSHAEHTEINVKSIEIDRSLGSDAATCTIVIDNAHVFPKAPEGVDTGPGAPGYYSYTRGYSAHNKPSVYSKFLPRGDVKFHTSWEYPKNYWFDKLVPNRLIRTYQGYGSDNFDEFNQMHAKFDEEYVKPQDDTKLVVTGTWLIDSVAYDTGGTITIACRDLGKMLLDQIVYPPLLPLSRFPLEYCPTEKGDYSNRRVTVSKNRLKYHSAANEKHHSKDFDYGGHHPRTAFDGRRSTEWWGHVYENKTSSYSKEWIQGTCHGNKINQVYINARFAGYTVYISVMEDGEWKGSHTIPYSVPDGKHSHDVDIPYVKKVILPGGVVKAWHYGTWFKLPRAYKADMVRFTFSNLHPFYPWSPSPYSVRVQDLKATKSKFHKVGPPGKINDWSEAIKELVSWAGFTRLASRDIYGDDLDVPDEADPLIGTSSKGPLQAWGDFERLGSGPIVCTPNDYLLNKTFMEACQLISNFLGCLFFVDEYGGIIFRMPNIYTGGNFITDPTAPETISAYAKRSWPIEFHEGANLLNYSFTVDDSRVRSEVVVVGTNPDIHSSAIMAGGVSLTNPKAPSGINFSNILAGMYRLMMVPADQTKNFKTVEECQRMAELIGIKILHGYRQGSATIIGHPALQLDDQVRIFERLTHEDNIHYVSGISSHMDLVSGTYTMDVKTNWLGGSPNSKNWFPNFVDASEQVKAIPSILERIGNDPGASGTELQPQGRD